ncbi:hypothetical protein [Mitsuokella sp.]|nr:hypothetical protein [Mitsuokella sp.]MDY4475367.1 hypothetical protein [Mitsuokella sp.]
METHTGIPEDGSAAACAAGPFLLHEQHGRIDAGMQEPQATY